MICNADIFRMIHYVLHFKKKYRHYFIFGIIYIYSSKRIEIVFHHEADYKAAMDYILCAQKMNGPDGKALLEEAI